MLFKKKLYYADRLAEYDRFMDEKYRNREDKGNIFGVGLTDRQFTMFIIDIILGEDWYAPSCVSAHDQVNEEALEAIVEKLGAKNVNKRKR